MMIMMMMKLVLIQAPQKTDKDEDDIEAYVSPIKILLI